MKKVQLAFLSVIFAVIFCGMAAAQMTFFLIDNFEDGDYTRNPEWWAFDGAKIQVQKNPSASKMDFVAQSCGEYSLDVKGRSKDWYIGGFGTNVMVDASEYSRLQLDVYGNKSQKGKLKIELYEDDNNNNIIEQDQTKGWAPKHDDIWATEIKVLGEGFTRYSIPFSAFIDTNPGIGNDKWDPNQKDKSGGLLKIQFISVADTKEGEADLKIDNVILTY